MDKELAEEEGEIAGGSIPTLPFSPYLFNRERGF